MAAIVFAATAPGPGRDVVLGDSLEGRPVRNIAVLAHNLYEPLPRGPLQPLYRIANHLHVHTRAATIRDALLLRPGDPWSVERARESMRALRSLGILEPQRIGAIPVDDSVDVRVETRDDWTTQPEFASQSANGTSFTSISLTERNVLGWGKGISLSYHEAPEGISRDAEYQDPNLFGSRLRLSTHAGTGSEGASQGFDVRVPFYAETTPDAYGGHWNLATSVAHLFVSGAEAASFDRRVEETEVDWGQGFLHGPDVVRMIGAFLVRDRRFGASRLEPGAPAEFAGGEDNVNERRWSGEIRWWRPGFIEVEGVERLGGIEDVDLGPTARLTAGFSPRWLGATADEGYLAGGFDGGHSTGRHAFVMASVDGHARLRRDPRETIVHERARWVVQPRRDHALVFAAYGGFAHRPERDYQEILGGLSGLRALPVRGLTGQQAWRFNAEHRWWAGREFFQLFSLGTAAFYDMGRTWG
ncbi:MAG: hypothetical protein E6K80_09785, partial [Candidatus Eisenbacteria bacterium]